MKKTKKPKSKIATQKQIIFLKKNKIPHSKDIRIWEASRLIGEFKSKHNSEIKGLMDLDGVSLKYREQASVKMRIFLREKLKHKKIYISGDITYYEALLLMDENNLKEEDVESFDPKKTKGDSGEIKNRMAPASPRVIIRKRKL